MRLPSPLIHWRSISTVSSPHDALLADKAITYLRRHPHCLSHLSTIFTPEAASSLLLKSQNDQSLTLKFVGWAADSQFFNPYCKCLALHVLTRFKLYKTAQSLAEALAIETLDEAEDPVFPLLRDSYYLCSSSSAVFDLVVKSYSHLNMTDRALKFVGRVKSHGFMPGVLSYNSILDAMIRSKKPVKMVEEVFGEMTKTGISPNVFTYNILMRGFCCAGNLEMGLHFFQEMEKKGCLPNVVTYNTLIDVYCKSRRIDDAYGLMRSMEEKNLEPNLISYNMIVNGLCREGRMKETSEVLKRMSRVGFVPDEVTYNTLVNGYCKEGNFHQALILHADMLRNGLSPNVITYTSLINSMCKARNLNRAMEFFDQMRDRGLHPNQMTYTTLIDGFSQQGFLKEAYRILEEMKGKGFLPTIVTYNALINGHCTLGRMEEAMGVIHDMEKNGITPDVVSYCTVIAGFCKHRDLDKAFDMKVKMAHKGIAADAITYSSLIEGLCGMRKLHEACDQFQEMLHIGLVPDEYTYTTLINAYCAEGNLNEAMVLHNEMIRKGFLPDVVTYNVLINGLNKKARTREAKRLLLKLFYDESVPDDITYDTLIESCTNVDLESVIALLKGFCMKGLMNEADQVFNSMLQRNYKPNDAVYNIMIHGHCRGGNVQKALDLYKEMVHESLVPHTVTVMALIKALHGKEMDGELSEVIGNTIRSCKLADGEFAKVLVEINHKEGNMDALFNVLSEMARNGLLPNSGRTAYVG
ncbi:hypothetical protein SAY86_018963 [Trapa natans]|uniref:Pentatricopeptide repeat-containing protein n=1 Tax=Trapa natans TaxID=22666 RepID=A0AAN7R1G2_TRANT|nr:hypothetical protein SAY86_018963 [Trapa natans]